MSTRQRQKMIMWTPERLEKLRAAYNRAAKKERLEFTFGGGQYVVSYAKYLIEYLDGVFAEEEE
jgi:hypothetical protein